MKEPCVICSWCGMCIPLVKIEDHRATCIPRGLGAGSKNIDSINEERGTAVSTSATPSPVPRQCSSSAVGRKRKYTGTIDTRCKKQARPDDSCRANESQHASASSTSSPSPEISQCSSSAVGRKRKYTGTIDTRSKKQARRDDSCLPNVSQQAGPSGYNIAASPSSTPGQCLSSADDSSPCHGRKMKITRTNGRCRKSLCSDSQQAGPSGYNRITTPSPTSSPASSEISQRFNGALTTVDVPVHPGDNEDIATFFTNNEDRLRNTLQSAFHQGSQVRPPSFKVYVDMCLRLVREDPDNGVQYTNMYMRSNMQVITLDDVESYLRELSEYFVTRFEKDMSDEEGSGFTLDEIVSVKFNIALIMHPNKIGEYVPYPKGVAGKSQVLNPSGPTDCVFQVLTAYRYLKSRNVVPSGRQWENACMSSVNTGDIQSPVSWEDLSRLERLNILCIRVYCLDSVKDKKAELTLIRKGGKEEEVVHCLLLGNRHLALIKDFDAYMNLFTARRKNRKKTFCDICMCACDNKTTLAEHKLMCPMTITSLKFPPAGSTVKFANYAKAYEPSYLCFYDFESLLVEPSSNGSTCVKKHHFAVAYAYIIVNRNGETVESGSYCGSDAVNNFINTMQRSWKKLKFAKGYNKINMTAEDLKRHNEQSHCQLCKREFPKGKSVKHHDHEIAGPNYIGAYCNRCNLQMKNHKLSLTLIAHNANYDMSLILRELTLPGLKIKLRPKHSVHKYHEVIINDLRFIDSYAFMPGSLAALAGQFIDNGNEPVYTREMLKDMPANALNEIINGKQSFCYDYMDSMERLSETCLPPREKFYNSLNQTELSESDYKHAKNVWKLAGCQTLKDYMMVYVKVDVGLLCDVFLDWRSILKKQWKLDIVNYVSLPGFSYDSFLLKTQEELEVLSNPDIYHCIQTNVRGGYTSVVRRFVRANNIYTNPHFNPEKDRSTFLSYLDFNSLYPTVMQEKLPCGDMRILDETEKQELLSRGLVNQAADGDFGYLILCDTEAVSRETAIKTDDLPLIIRRHAITNKVISPVTREWYEEENRQVPSKNIKLIGTHAAQTNMLFALPLLKLLIELGLVVKKVHAIYTFKQKHFLAEFIQDNIEARKRATCPVKKNSIKCISNSIFGRFLMNAAKYSEDVDIVTTREKFLTLVRSPYFKRVVPLNDEHVVVVRHKKYTQVNHPNYIGYYILELSKVRLYDFYYNVLKRHYGDRVKLVYCDTDSLITEFETPDLLKEYSQEPLKRYIDTSNFNPSHPLYSTIKKGELGCLKSEVGERTISEFVGVRPKCYSILLVDGDRLSSAKGVPKPIKKKISHERYKNALFQKQAFTFNYRGFTVRDGRMSTVKYPKRGISIVEDKRYYLSPLESRSYGHPDNSTGVEEEEEEEEPCIMTLSNDDNAGEGDERTITEARLADAMGGQEETGEEEETYELWGERDMLADKYFPSSKRGAQEKEDDDMLMLATEQEEIRQLFESPSLEYMDFSE